MASSSRTLKETPIPMEMSTIRDLVTPHSFKIKTLCRLPLLRPKQVQVLGHLLKSPRHFRLPMERELLVFYWCLFY